MRLFAAIFPPATLQSHLERIVSESKIKYPDGVFVKPEKMHFTLRFFGEYDLRSAEAMIANACNNVNSFDVEMDQLGAFPSASRARVLFAAVRNPSPLEHLMATLTAPGDRDPHPHLTIARFKEPREIEPEKIDPIEFRADAIKLVNSILGREPRYEVLREWKLS